MASIRENDSEFMNETLTRFANMKGSPEKLLHSADVAVLLIADINSMKNVCGVAYPDTGFPFSVVLHDCSLLHNTFSHEIAHNFGVMHSSGHVFEKRFTSAGEPASKYEKGLYYRTVMAQEPEDMIDKIGFDITAMIAGLGLGGLALALAAQDSVKNIWIL